MHRHEPYKPEQRQWLMGLDDYIAMATGRDRQGLSQPALA